LLQKNLEKNLLAYAAAASSGLLAMAQPAAAQIVYTPSNIPLAQPFVGGAITEFDINNDGVADFAFNNYSYFSHGLGRAFVNISPNQVPNAIVGVQLQGQKHVTAAALNGGVEVGPAANFQSNLSGVNLAIIGAQNLSSAFASGSFLTVQTAYLGLKFVVNGETHYGWARIKLVRPGAFPSASIYGYAYESTPNLPIITGKTTGAAKEKLGAARIPTDKARTLGMLAAGAVETR
jgi:hypothetical protein